MKKLQIEVNFYKQTGKWNFVENLNIEIPNNCNNYISMNIVREAMENRVSDCGYAVFQPNDEICLELNGGFPLMVLGKDNKNLIS